MIPAMHYFSRLIRQTLHRRAAIRALILPAILVAGLLTEMSEAQVVNVPTPSPRHRVFKASSIPQLTLRP